MNIHCFFSAPTELSCASGLVFKYNVKACNSSCRSLSERDRSCDVEDVPVDGCACPDGTYRNSEGNCVQRSQCDCYMDDEVIQPGRLIHIEDNTWYGASMSVSYDIERKGLPPVVECLPVKSRCCPRISCYAAESLTCNTVWPCLLPAQ